ncbi:MAG: phenylacetate--CoA ligase family protein [Firmicutes bacterium]|nr:phenylacetate--CoA ligase family protein [Bacillota bacterium]
MKEWIKMMLGATVRRAPAVGAEFIAAKTKAMIARRDLGSTYQSVRAHIRSTEYATGEEIRAFQLKKCKDIVQYAWEHCSGYREHWKKYGFAPEQLQSYSDIRRIPEISKEQIRDNLAGFSTKESSRCKYITTSGSTGIPLGLYLDRAAESTEFAFLHDMWEERSFCPVSRSVIIRGAGVQGGFRGNPYAELTLFGDLLLSAYHITRETAHLYLDTIKIFKPGYIQAYPSALTQLTIACIETGISIEKHDLQAIILASEKLYDKDKEYLQRFWKAPLIHFYGMTEKVILAGPCKSNDLFHVYPQYGLAEVIKEDGSEAAEDEMGHLVGTSFFMRKTLFIRYRTGDLAVKGNNYCPDCRRHYLLLKEIVGRNAELIITDDYHKIPFSMAIGSIHNKLFQGMDQFQFMQATAGNLVCKYVSHEEMPTWQKQAIETDIREKVGKHLQLSFQRVPIIPKNVNGKYSFFKSELLGGGHDEPR